jgi:hypothetical protein
MTGARWLAALLRAVREPPLGHSPSEPDTGQLPDNPAEQAFARWTWAGARLAFFWIGGAFALYVSGVLPPGQPIAEVERQFHLPAGRFVAETGAPRGWSWLQHLGQGDALSLAGLVFTVAVLALAYLATLRVLLRQRDWLYAALVAAQIGVFVWAALAP